MPVPKLQFRNWKVPVAILCFLILSAFCAYAGMGDTPYATTLVDHDLARIGAFLSFACALLLLGGYLAARSGWTKQELDRWGDDMLAGKPPL